MHYALLAFIVFAFMSATRCVPLVNLKTSDNLQNLETILETLDTFDDLNDYNLLCEKNKIESNEFLNYCTELINKNSIYSPKNFTQTKINVIRSNLLKLLSLENKAISCRGMRHLLPIIMYGIFINNTVNGSAENGNSGKDIFDKLFENKFGFLNNKNSSIEKKLQEIKVSMMKNFGTNKKLDETPVQSKEKFAVTSSNIMKNIMTTIQLILPFIEELDYFYNLYKINKVWTADKYDRNLLLLLIFDEVKRMYKTECNADVDATALLQNRDGKWDFELNYDSIPLLVGEIDRLSVTIQKDLELLFVKFFPANNLKHQFSDMSIMYHQTINKYHDPEVWRLIGNEAIVDHSSDSGETVPTSIDKVVPNLSKMIQKTTDSAIELVTKKITCRYLAYFNLLVKLFYSNMCVLAVNAREVQRSIQMLQGIKYYDDDKFKNLLHDTIKELGTDKCFNGYDVSAIDELLDRNGGDENFRYVYAYYWNYNAKSIRNAIENGHEYLLDWNFGVELVPMVREIDRIQILQPKMKSVEFLFNRYKLGKRVFKDYCFSDSDNVDYVFTFSNNITLGLQATKNNTEKKLTLDFIITMIETINEKMIKYLETFYF